MVSEEKSPWKRHDDHEEDKRDEDLYLAALKERLKVLDHIPTLLTWKNREEGSRKTFTWLITIFIGVIFTGLFTFVLNVKSDMVDKHKSHVITIEKQQEHLATQVKSIEMSIDEIKTKIAVFLAESRLENKQQTKEREDTNRAIKELKDELIRLNNNNNSGK